MKTVDLRSPQDRTAQIFFLIFVALIGLGTSNYLIEQLYGINIKSTVGVSLNLLSIFPLFGVYVFTILSPTTQVKKNSTFVNCIFAFTHFLLIYAFAISNDFNKIFEDYWIALIVFLSYKISLNQSIWKLFDKEMIVIFIIFCGITLLGTTIPRQQISEIDNVEAVEKALISLTATTAYEVSSILDFWPLIFLYGLAHKKFFRKALTLFPLVFYVILQFFFLKRAPSIRGIVQYIFGIAIYLLHIGGFKKYVNYFVSLILFLCVMYFVFPDELVDRFKNDDSSRPDEIKNMFNQFGYIDYFIGRGLGGGYVSDNFIFDIRDSLGRDIRTIMHIGVAYPFLKGGLILFSLIFFHLLSLFIIGFRRIKSLSREQIASLSFLIVFVMFRFIEGPISTGNIFNSMLFGLSIGCLEYQGSVKNTTPYPFQ